MKPTRDALYLVHQCQAKRRGQTALPYEEFCVRAVNTHETDLTGLLPPAPNGIFVVDLPPELQSKLGLLRITQNAAATVPSHELTRAVERHAAGDWGTLTPEDWKTNDLALREGGPLYSRYEIGTGVQVGREFWVFTNPGRTLTTVFLREDLPTFH